MEIIRSQFIFNKEQRAGIFFLIFIIVGLLGIFHFVDFSEVATFDITSNEIKVLQKEMDSLRQMELDSKKLKIFRFNPNFIDDYKGYVLGMSVEEIDRLLEYRSKDKWVNSASEFQRITKVSDSLLDIIAPMFKFPEWVNKPTYNRSVFKEKVKNKSDKSDLNLATELQLQKISGIGKTLSKRIINYRNKLGGFTSDLQLFSVYGLDEIKVKRLLNQFTVKTPKEIYKMDLNNASASDLSTIPGISFELGKKIWEYIILNEGVKSFSELKKIEGMSERKLEVIQLYLSLD